MFTGHDSATASPLPRSRLSLLVNSSRFFPTAHTALQTTWMSWVCRRNTKQLNVVPSFEIGAISLALTVQWGCNVTLHNQYRWYLLYSGAVMWHCTTNITGTYCTVMWRCAKLFQRACVRQLSRLRFNVNRAERMQTIVHPSSDKNQDRNFGSALKEDFMNIGDWWQDNAVCSSAGSFFLLPSERGGHDTTSERGPQTVVGSVQERK
jgi:hypothetical protein